MDIEIIKTQFISEVTPLIESTHSIEDKKSGNSTWKEKVNETNRLIKNINNSLQDFLKRQNICFKNYSERYELECSLEPTIYELILKNMKE